jgi:flavin-dependent dehydrogenase
VKSSDDVLIVGAGPAGSIAATLLARAGARVRLLDRAMFPRDKLCGDTVNPGTVAALARMGLSRALEAHGLPVDGMRLTGPLGAVVEARYPDGLRGRAILRRDLDWSLVEQAVATGARFEPGTPVRRPLLDASGAVPTVRGVTVGSERRERTFRAPVTLAADGRRSTLAFFLGLARHPQRPRRWAVGGYYENARGLSAFGEMHVRPGRYVGVAAIPGGLANVCLVRPRQPANEAMDRPARALDWALMADPFLRDRFADARLIRPPMMLGPLAVDVHGMPPAGLLLAGDAAGFIDPMTGDGLGFAVRGGALAAAAALEALENGWAGVHERLGAARRNAFAPKWRFNRALRAVVGWAPFVEAGDVAARIVPRAIRQIVRFAGDCQSADVASNVSSLV